MEKGVAITGMGIISAIGNNVEENYHSLKSGRHGISSPQFLQTRHSQIPVGEIKISNTDLQDHLKLSAGHAFTRSALLGSIAIREALEQSGIKRKDLETTGLISAGSVGGMDMTEKYYKDFSENSENRRFIQAQHPGFTTTRIQEYFGVNGFVTTISTACSSSANAIMLGARMIKAGKLKRVIVGGTDCLTRFTLNGFNSLMILSAEVCKPFDENRSGLNLGEGAAYLILEADDILGIKKYWEG
jgi:3-oxoacyl-(acyl-carrier-protein) synthase